MRLQNVTTLPLIAALALVTAACASPQSRGDEGASGKPAEKHTVIYAEGARTVSDWDHYVALALDLYEKNGVELDSVSTQTAVAATQLLVTGEANIGRGLAPTVQVVSQSNGGVTLVDVADILIRPPFIINSKSGSTMSDLAGLKLGVSSPTDSTSVVASGGTGARLAALVGGALDAALLLPPANFTAEDEGFARVGYLPEDLGEDWVSSFTAIIVEPEWAAANEGALIGILTARHEALQFLADPKNRDEAIEILAEATDVTVEIAEKTYELLGIATDRSAFATEIGVSEAAAQDVLTVLQDAGQASEDMELSDITDDSYAAKVRAASAK
jgi:NitT/TauT family transport system substrate-binding protein